jgi:dolichyl-phosphate-mannose-protein mannosyltransferase
VLFMALSLLCYVKFHQQRYREFSRQWWGWMLATGAALACTLGCKMVGLFTFASVGAAVLWDLWGILDIKKGHQMVSTPSRNDLNVVGSAVLPCCRADVTSPMCGDTSGSGSSVSSSGHS